MIKKKSDVWFVYVVRCADDSLYTGIARDVAARIAQHDAGKGARYTRGRGPLRLCAKKKCFAKGDALRLELAIKKLSRKKKETLARARRIRIAAPKTTAAVRPATRPSHGVARRAR